MVKLKLQHHKYHRLSYPIVSICHLPGIVGEIGDDSKEYYIWTHKKFDIGFNENQIVDVNLTSDAKVKLEVGAKISFSYEVRVKSSKISQFKVDHD